MTNTLEPQFPRWSSWTWQRMGPGFSCWPSESKFHLARACLLALSLITSSLQARELLSHPISVSLPMEGWSNGGTQSFLCSC